MAFLSTKVIQKVPFFSDKQHNNKTRFLSFIWYVYLGFHLSLLEKAKC